MTRPEGIQRSVVLRGHGHPAIRATHAKTFELMAQTEISERATCVVAVGTGFDPDTLRDLALLRGAVRLVLSTPDLPAFLGEAVINPGHAVTDRIVVRRREADGGGGHDDADTLATDSTLTAKDLDGAFAAALADPGREVTLVVEEIGTRRPLVLVGTTPRGETLRLTGRDRTLWSAADVFVDYTGGAPILPAGKLAKLASDALAVLGSGGVVSVAVPSLDAPPPAVAADFLARAARLGARFAILPRGGARTAAEALLAAGLPSAPHSWLAGPQRLSTLPAMPTVFRMPAGVPPSVLGDREVWVEDTADRDLGVAMRQVSAVDAVALPGALTVVGPSDDAADAVDVAAVARALADAGIAPRTLSEALAPFGLTRKRLYALLQDSDPAADTAPERRY